ncbi:MAG: hypothetical protein ACRELF_17325, partial [Gemmataceae bacterium]
MVRVRWFVLVALFLLVPRSNLAQKETKPTKSKETKEQAAKVEPLEPTDEPTTFNPQPKNLLGSNNDVWSVAFTPDGKR